ncbi:MAG: acylphosphatase [Firmicutes bacterium]|uniref:acylphosphatase n=1 Tax=Melghirimyces thermohalophilus TaxID=1236220 RepID=A0A1G6LW05_9BACL|nr:acylphosphatase [Melghirimyces thermohalophilus]MDA8351824.1 acylphosphatase [Bacillota bacterium]SDC47277.1 acylphosphatase [Melghirimyces thermohalophilus]
MRQRIIVHGHVQGVGFRQYTRLVALRMGVRGWVRNRADGTVEIDAQAPASKMERFVEAVRKGSPASTVDRLETQNQTPTNRFQDFRIRYS